MKCLLLFVILPGSNHRRSFSPPIISSAEQKGFCRIWAALKAANEENCWWVQENWAMEIYCNWQRRKYVFPTILSQNFSCVQIISPGNQEPVILSWKWGGTCRCTIAWFKHRSGQCPAVVLVTVAFVCNT